MADFICVVPRRLSLDENVCAKEGGKETTGCTLPVAPCGSSLVTRVRVRLYHAKNEALKEEAAIALNQVDEHDDCTQPYTKQFHVNEDLKVPNMLNMYRGENGLAFIIHYSVSVQW